MKALILALTLLAAPALAEPLKIIAAENFYGDLARQIGGAHVDVTSILANPEDDPHSFAASPSTARALAKAQIVIANGAGYDPWMQRLLSASTTPARVVIDVGAVAGVKPGANPHLWYSLKDFKTAAHALSEALAKLDPAHSADYAKGETVFIESLKPVEDKITLLEAEYRNLPVASTEPVFDEMAIALGLRLREQRFALAVMNDVEPPASAVAEFEHDLRTHAVRALIHNAQESKPTVQRLVALAKENHIPVVGVTETEPPGLHYQDWMMSELNALETALKAAP